MNKLLLILFLIPTLLFARTEPTLYGQYIQNGSALITLPTTSVDMSANTNAQFQYLDATSSIQTQIDNLVAAVAGINVSWGSISGTLSSQTDLQSALNAKEPTITAGTTSQYYRGDKSFQTLDKTAVGLANVDNTSDANKPVSTAQATAIALKENSISAGTTSQYWRGDKSFQTLDKTAVGLSNVDNTSDVNKPISTATQAALDLKAPLADSSLYRVGPGRQYTTIQSALTAIGNATSLAELKQAKVVSIAGGVYDEDLVIPQGRIITLLAEGTVILGNGLGTNWSSTDTKTVTFTANNADAFGGDIKPALNIVSIAGSDPTSTFLAEAGTFRISGALLVAGDGLSHTINLSNTEIDGAITKTAAGLTNLQGYKLLVKGAVNMATSTILERCYDCQFNALVTVDSYNAIINSEFQAGMTVAANISSLPPSGMFFTTFTGTFTGPANSLKLDRVSDYFFTANGATLGGSASKVLLSSAVNLAGTEVTSTLPIGKGGTGNTSGTATINANLTGEVTSVGNAASLGSFTSASLSGALTNETGTGLAVFATSPTLVTPALGTPSALVGTNITGTAAGLTAGNVTTNANLTGPITSVGNATSVASQTGTGSTFVMNTSPTLITPALGTPTALVGTNITGTASGLTAGSVTTNANLTGDVTSVGNATSYNSIVPINKGGTGSATQNFVDLSSSQSSIAGNKTFTNQVNFDGIVEFTQQIPNFYAGIRLFDAANTFTSVQINQSLSQAADIAWTLPPDNGASPNYVLTNNGSGVLTWNSPAATGVTSVALTAPSFLSVSGSPITSTGTLALTLATQAANKVFAGPATGADATPTFRSLVAADIPAISISSGISGLGTGVATFLGTPSSANLRSALTDESGTGLAYFQGGDIGTPSAGVLTNATGLPISSGVSGLAANVATVLGTPSSANLRAALTDESGSGAALFQNGDLGTPSAGVLTNATGLPISSGVSGLGTGVSTFLGTPSSANLASALTNETGSGLAVFDTAPTITNLNAVTPTLGAASGTSLVLGGTINANALLDVQSTTKAFMPPRMTTTQKNAISSPTAGMIVYDSTLGALSIYDGSVWGSVSPTSINATSAPDFSFQVDNTGVVSGESTDAINGNCTNANPTVCTFNSIGLTAAPNCTTTITNTANNLSLSSPATSTSTTVTIQQNSSLIATREPFVVHCQKSGADYVSAYRGGVIANTPRIAYVSYSVASGTGGGSSVASTWTDRPLNILVDTDSVGASLSANTITLPAGTYHITAQGMQNNSNNGRIRLQNTSDSTTAITGVSCSDEGVAGAVCPLDGQVIITASKNFKIQHYVNASVATIGLGRPVSTGANEVHTTMTIEKIK